MKASTAGGRWGKKRKKKKKKAPVFTPSCVTPVGSRCTEKYTAKCSTSKYTARCSTRLTLIGGFAKFSLKSFVARPKKMKREVEILPSQLETILYIHSWRNESEIAPCRDKLVYLGPACPVVVSSDRPCPGSSHHRNLHTPTPSFPSLRPCRERITNTAVLASHRTEKRPRPNRDPPERNSIVEMRM